MKSSDGLLLSILVQGRNDSYMGNFLWRLSTCINKHADNACRLGAHDQVEVVLTDWGSGTPLAQALSLSDDARQFLQIVEVPPETAARYNRNSPYSWVHAVNTGVRRCRGKFILFCDSDGYLPVESLEKLIEGIARNRLGEFALGESFFVGSRRHIPASFHSKGPGLEEIDAFIQEKAATFEHDKVNLAAFGGNAASYFWSKQIWAECRGCDERLIQWGWSDIDLFIRLASRYRAADLEDLEVVTFHLEHYLDRESRTAQKGLDRPRNPTEVPASYAPNGPDWGLAREPLPVIAWSFERELPVREETARADLTEELYFVLQKQSRIVYLMIVAIDRDPSKDPALTVLLAELSAVRNRLLSMTSTWVTRKIRGDSALLAEAIRLRDEGHQTMARIFNDPRFQSAWKRVT